MSELHYSFYEDYLPLLPPYKGFSEKDIEIIEFFKAKQNKDIDLIFTCHSFSVPAKIQNILNKYPDFKIKNL